MFNFTNGLLNQLLFVRPFPCIHDASLASCTLCNTLPVSFEVVCFGDDASILRLSGYFWFGRVISHSNMIRITCSYKQSRYKSCPRVQAESHPHTSSRRVRHSKPCEIILRSAHTEAAIHPF